MAGSLALDPTHGNGHDFAVAGRQAGLHGRQARIFAGAGHQAAAEAAPTDHKWIPVAGRFAGGSGGDQGAGPNLGNGPSLPLAGFVVVSFAVLRAALPLALLPMGLLPAQAATPLASEAFVPFTPPSAASVGGESLSGLGGAETFDPVGRVGS